MYILATNNCESYTFLQIIYFIKLTLQIISIAVPIILIVNLMIKFTKAMALGEEQIRKVSSSAIKTIIPAIIIFFVPTIISVVFSMLGVTNFKSLACWDDATKENVQTAKVNEYLAKYQKQIDIIKPELELTLERLGEDVKEEEKQEIEDIENNLEEAIKERDTIKVSTNVKKLKKINKTLDNRYRKLVWEDILAKVPDISSASGVNENVVKLIMGYEGNHGYCDSSKTTYKAINIGDGAVTIGYGITNYTQEIANSMGYGQYFPMKVGQCIPVNVIDTIFGGVVKKYENEVLNVLSKYNVTGWSQNKIDAMTSLSYNKGISRTETCIKKYTEGGDDALWGYMKTIVVASNGSTKFTQGLKKRRDGEWHLYLTGDYNTGFYNRNLQYY